MAERPVITETLNTLYSSVVNGTETLLSQCQTQCIMETAAEKVNLRIFSWEKSHSFVVRSLRTTLTPLK